MADPTQAFTRNQFVDKMMSWIPQDPKTQAAYMYSLTAVVFFWSDRICVVVMVYFVCKPLSN